MITKIISGGQTGADQGGLVGAKDAGVPTGGYAPKNFLTEDGHRPRLLQDFGLVDSGLGYAGRTWLNAEKSDVTIWFGKTNTPGHFTTMKAVKEGKFIQARFYTPEQLAEIIKPYSVVNIAGNRESKNPGIFEITREVVREMLLELKKQELET